MATVETVVAQARELFGRDMAEAHVSPALWVAAVQWAQVQLNRALRLVVNDGSISVSDRDAVALPPACQVVLFIYASYSGGIMKVLPKAEYNHLMRRRPDYATTTRPATCWAFVNPTQIVIDGSVGQATVMVHYLQQPNPVTDLASTLDSRMDVVDTMAFAYLAAAYCLQTAGDAASLRRAGQYFAQGMRIAGVRERVSMPLVSDGGEREAQHEGE